MARRAVAADANPEGLALLQAPAGASGCSWGGQSFDVDPSGIVMVPQAAVRDLIAHGFVVVDSD